MIENLIKSALGDKGSELLGGLDLSADTKQKALDLAQGSVMEGLKDSVMSGNFSEITKAFSGGTSSSLVRNIISKYGTNLISKLGFLNPFILGVFFGTTLNFLF